MRTIIIGDIHGCDRTLEALLKRVALDTARDRLVLLGDLFDRGPASWEVWQRVQALEQTLGERFVLLRGNHEEYWLRDRPSLSARLLHERVGRQTTVDSFSRHNAKVRDSRPWLLEHTVPFYRDERLQYVHAAVEDKPLEENDPFLLMHDHEAVLRNEYAGPLTVTGHIALEEAAWFPGNGEPVQPLTAGMRYPLPERGVLCLDTGCGKGGKLTAMVLREDGFELLQIPELDNT